MSTAAMVSKLVAIALIAGAVVGFCASTLTWGVMSERLLLAKAVDQCNSIISEWQLAGRGKPN